MEKLPAQEGANPKEGGTTHLAAWLTLLADCNGGSILESHPNPLHLGHPLDCLGNHAPEAASRAEKQFCP